ncbi:trypsin-like peptidase domain-containing protein [Streptomyces sp. NPDC007084]|uniref:trypsin-like peptidase domain-containing protein n=1 Tax=Streptomyces sp. NPDC007084 TaxID=3154313 RepID=UPI003454425D
MAGRGARTGDPELPDDVRETWDGALVRVCDLAGRPRGTGFAADHHGTVVTSHEAVDGLPRLVLHAPGDRTRVVTADAVVPLPHAGLALIRTEGLGLDPLPVTVRDRVATGTYVRIAAGTWREARVLETSAVTYTATDRFHLLRGALELAIGTAGADALRLGGGAAGGPVVDAATGAVVAVVGTALLPPAPDDTGLDDLPSAHRAPGFAVPLRGVPGPLAELLERNAATVPAYGADLNLAGVLELTATSVGSDGPRPPGPPGTAGAAFEPVERADVVRELNAFEAGRALVLGLVGPPGSGRTTELAALAARRAHGPVPAPTLWLRGADLLAHDTSVADAAHRALERAGRIVAASRQHPGAEPDERDRPAGAELLPPAGYDGELGDIGPDRLARLAHTAGRPLLLLLDGPEEMPPELAHRLPAWTRGTADWLAETGARLVIGCRAEYWEHAGSGFPAGLPHDPDTWGPGAASAGEPDTLLPPCVRLGDLTEEEAARARARAGIPEGALAAADARHPLVLRLLGEIRAALPDLPGEALDRDAVFAAHLDLMCLRIAVRLAAANGLRGTAVRRLAARVSGQVHEAARRSLGPGQGELDRASFEAVFPWGTAPGPRFAGVTGWASAVLTEGLLVPAGDGYRFAHEELADWIQGTHLDLDGALHTLVHRARIPAATGEDTGPADRTGPARRRARRSRQTPDTGASRPRTSGATRTTAVGGSRPTATGGTRATATGVTGARGARQASGRGRTSPGDTLPVPRHRIGPVAETLLLLARQQGTAELALRLEDLVRALDELLPPGEERAGRDQAGPEPAGYSASRDQAGSEPAGYSAGQDQAGSEPAGYSASRDQAGSEPAGYSASRDQAGDALWWSAHLCADVLLRVPDATPYTGVLRLLTERITAWREQGRTVPARLGPAFWAAVPLPPAERFDLLRRLVVTDPRRTTPASTGADLPDEGPGAPRHLDTVARLLAEDPTAVQPHLTRWFDDERALPAMPHATVAAAAQALLYAHRRGALDDLAEALVDCAHRRGDELLAALAEEEPSAVCRAVDRWAHDERPARRVAAVAYGLRAAPFAATAADRELLRYAALAVLARPTDATLHGGALGILVRDPLTRERHLPQALERFAAGDARLSPDTLVTALTTHPEPVFAAFRDRLRRPGPDTAELLRTLAGVTTPALARRIATLVREAVQACPEAAAHIAAYVERCLDHGEGAHLVLFPLVSGLLAGCPGSVRTVLAQVLAAPDTGVSAVLRRELLDLLLAHERDPAVLGTALRAAADGFGARGEEPTRALVHRVGLLLVRTPDGATGFDRGLVDLARHVPGFAPLMARWLNDAPDDWSCVVGPSTRRMIENLAGPRVPA